MSFLEYLGLEYLLGDNNSEASGGIFGGILVFGIFAWLLLAIFHGSLLDKGAVIFNLLAAIALLIITIVKFIKTIKNKRTMNKIFYIASIAVVIGAFVYGLKVPYHALFFNYEYIGIYSGIGTIFWPLVIINMLFPFFCTNDTVKEKIGTSFGAIALTLLILVIVFFIGQVVTLIVSFTNNEATYDKIVKYHNASVTEERENWEYESSEDCIRKNLPVDAKNFVERYQETNVNMKNYKQNGDTASIEKYTMIYLQSNYPVGEMADYSILFSARKWEDDYTVVYRLLDKEYCDYYYVKFNWRDYSIIEFVNEEYYQNIDTNK